MSILRISGGHEPNSCTHLAFRPGANHLANVGQGQKPGAARGSAGADLTQQRLRRGSFHHVTELIRAISDYIDNNNQNPRVFVWSASVEQILTKLAKCKEALDALR
jgi:hypothetical protein